MIEERQFLNFIPPRLDGETYNMEMKNRYMIVARSNSNLIEMINISKISGKNKKNLIKDYNVLIEECYPLRLPSFAKTNTLYTIEYFPELEDYISFGGEKLNEIDFNNILLERERYIDKTNNIKVINFTKEEFLEKNKDVALV